MSLLSLESTHGVGPSMRSIRGGTILEMAGTGHLTCMDTGRLLASHLSACHILLPTHRGGAHTLLPSDLCHGGFTHLAFV